MSNKPTALTVARSYHRAWNDKRFDAAVDCLAETLAIEVPINAYSTRSSFIDAVRQTREMTSDVTVLAEFGNENDALILYDMTFPFGAMRVAEHFTIDGGRIVRIRQIHDTAVIRAALGAVPQEGAR